MSIIAEIHKWSRHAAYCDNGHYHRLFAKRRDLRLNDFDAYRLVRELADQAYSFNRQCELFMACIHRDPWRVLVNTSILGHRVVRI